MIKKLTIVGIAIIIVVIAVVVCWALIPSVDGETTDWDPIDPNISGQWKTELWITFADGTEVLADDFNEGGVLSFFFRQPDGTKEVTSITYKVSAKASTAGIYDVVYIDLSNIMFEKNVMLAGTATTIYEGTGVDIPLGTVNIPADNQFHDLCTYTHGLSHPGYQSAIEANPYDNGYSFGFFISGGINFRGSPDESWQGVNSPALASITLVAISNEMFLDLSGDVIVVYT